MFFLQLTEQDQEIYKDFNLTISERWQQETAGKYYILIALVNLNLKFPYYAVRKITNFLKGFMSIPHSQM